MTKRPGFARFAASSALATSLAVVLSVALQPAFGQVLPTGGVVQAGAVTLRNNGNFVGTGTGTTIDPFVTAANNGDGLGLVVGGANTVLTWDSFSIGGTNNVAFSRNGNAAFTVLNIVTGPTASDLRGALTGDGNGSIWLINPNGIAFNGSGSATNLASLVLSTLPLTEVNGAAYDAATFTGANGSNYRFAGNGTAGITIAANGSLAAGSNLLLVAPQIATAGTLAAGADAALVVAANTRIAVSATGLLSITIDAGSAVANGLDISGGVTANRLYAVAASAADIAANLLSISGPLVSPNIVVAVGRSAAGSGVSFGAGATSTANVAISRNLPDSGAATTISVESTGDIAVTGAGNTNRTITGSYVADGAVSITAGGDLSFADNASVSAGKALLASGDSVTLGSGVALRSDSAGAGGFDLTIAANGNNRVISGQPTSSLAAGMRDAGGAEGRTSDVVLTQDAGEAISLGRIDARQLVLTNAASAFTLGDVTTTNALALTANGAISLASATSTASGVTLLSNNSSVSVGNTGSATAFDISLTGVGVSSTGNAVSGKDFKVDATTGIATVAGNVTAAGIIDVLGGSVVLGANGQSRTQQAVGLARYDATAGSLSTAGATAIISNSANNVAGANLSLKASAAIAAGAATLSAGTNDAGRRDVSLSAGGTANLTTGAIYAQAVTSPTEAAGTISQPGTIRIARIDSATAVTATSTANSVFIGTAGAGNESRAPSFAVTANAGNRTASIINAVAASGNITAMATGGTASATGIATAGFITADGNTATATGNPVTPGSGTAGGNAATFIRATGTTTSQASGSADGDISAIGGEATASGDADGSIIASGGTANASGTAAANIAATATGTAIANGTATAGFITADGRIATASGDAGTYIRATGATSATASGTTMRLLDGTGADISATATGADGIASASGTARTDVIAIASGNKGTARIGGTAERDIRASAKNGTVIFDNATAKRDITATANIVTVNLDVGGTGNDETAQSATLTAGDDIVLAAPSKITVGSLVISDAPGPDSSFGANQDIDPSDVQQGTTIFDAEGNTILDPTVSPAAAITGLGGQKMILKSDVIEFTGDITALGDRTFSAKNDLILGKRGQNKTFSATGRLELVAGRSILVEGRLTLRADSDGTGNDPLVLRAGAIAPEANKASIDLTGATLAAGNRSGNVEGRQSDIIIAPRIAAGEMATAFNGLTLGTSTDSRGLFRAISESMGSFTAGTAGQLDLAGAINLGQALTVVQRLDVRSTDASVTAGDVRVLGRAEGAARSLGIDVAARDDLVLTGAGAVSVTTTARNFTNPLRNTGDGSIANPLRDSGGGSVVINAGTTATIADARARENISVGATGSATLTNAHAGRNITLAGAAATGGRLRAGNDIIVAASDGDAMVTDAETTFRVIDAQLPDSNAFTGTLMADAALRSSIGVSAMRGNATLTKGVTADRSIASSTVIGEMAPASIIRVTAPTGGNTTGNAMIGDGSVANAISATGAISATITNGLARRGNIEAIATATANASGTARRDDSVAGGNIIARADSATARGTADVDIFADGNVFASASGRAGNDIIATASGGRALAAGGAGRDLLATATGGAPTSGGITNPGLATIGTAGTESTAGRDSIASARDGSAAAGTSLATLVNLTAGRDAIASAANAGAERGIRAGDDIILVASRGNVVVTGALTADGLRTGDVETLTTIAASDGFGAIADPLTAADIRDPIGFTSTLQNLVGANIVIRAKGDATIGDATLGGAVRAASDYRVGASGIATLGTGAAVMQSAGNRVLIAAGSVTLRDGLALFSNELRANVGSAGATIINAQRDILGADASVTARRKAGATQAEAPDATLSVAATAGSANGQATIKSVDAGFVLISAPRSIDVASVTATRGVEISGVVTPVVGSPSANDVARVKATTITIDRGTGADSLTGAFVAAPVTLAGGAGAALETLAVSNGATASALRILADTGDASLRATSLLKTELESVLVESQTGRASIGTALAGQIELRGRQPGSSATANTLDAIRDVIATADTSVGVVFANSDTANVLVLANGAATLTTGRAARNIDLRSINALASTTSLMAGGRIAISGNSVSILTDAKADDDLLVGSATSIAATGAELSAGRSRAADAQLNDTTPALETRFVTLTGTALTPALAVGTTGYGNGRGQLVDDTTAFADRLTAAPVTGLLGQNVVLTAAGDISVGTVLAARDIIAEAGQALTLGIADAGRDLSGVSGWRTAANTTIITSATAGDDLVLVAERGNIVATGATLIASGAGADSDASDRTTVTLADRATGLREPFVDFATGKAIAGQLGSNLTLAASGSVTLGDSQHTAARDLRIDAGGAISATRLVAGRDLIAVAGLTSDADLTLSGSASAGDDLLLIAQRGSVIATSAVLTTAGDIAENTSDDAAGQFLADRQTILTDPLTGLSVTDITGRNLLLLARDNVDSSAGSLTAASDLRVEAGGSATLFNASAGRDLFAVTGWLIAGDLTIATPDGAVFSAGDDLVLLARRGSIASGTSTLNATGLGTDNDAGAGAIVLGDGVTGLVDIHTDKSIAGLGGSNTVMVARDSIVNSAAIRAARDARIEAGGAVSLATLDAGRDAVVLGGINQRGDVAIGATASAGDDLILASYNGSVQATTATLSAAGRNDNEAGNEATAALFADFATSITDPLSRVALTRLGGGNVLVGASAAIDSSLGAITASTDVRADAGLGVSLNTVTAGRDIAAAAGLTGDAALLIAGAMSAGDDLTLLAPRGSITTTGRFSLAATGTGADNDSGASPRAPSRLDGSSAATHGATGMALALQPGSNIVVTARDDIDLASHTVTANADLRAEAGRNIVLGSATAGSDLIAVSGLLAEATTQVVTSAIAGDDLVLVAKRGGLVATAATLASTGEAGVDDDSSATAILRLADGVTAVASPLQGLLAGAPADQAIASLDGRNLFLIARDSVDSSAGTLTATTDLRVEAGRTATLKTATAGRDLIGVAGWLEAGDFIVTGSAKAGDDLLLASQRRDVIVSGATLTTTGAGVNNDSADATAAVLANRIAIVEPLTGDAASSFGSTALAGLAGSNLTLAARRDIIGSGASLVASAARDVRIEAGRSLTIGTASAGRDLVAIAGAREAGTLTIVTSATAGDDLVLVAQRGAITATATTLSTTGAADVDNDSTATAILRLADGVTAVASPLQGLLAGAPADQAIASLDGRSLFLIARDSVDSSAGTLTATTDLRVEAGRTATLKTATAGRDLIGVAGWLEAGDFIVTGSTQAGDDLLLASQRRDVIVSGATLTTTGAGVNNDSADATAAVLANRIAIVEPLTGDAASSFGSTALAGLVGSNLTLAARRDVIGSGASLVASAARDVRIEAGRTLTIGSATAGRDLVAIAGAREAGNLTIGSGSVGDDIVLVASRGAIDATALMTSGSGSDSEVGSETTQTRLADGITLVEDPTRAGSEPSTAVRFATTTLAGSNIRTASSTATRIDSAKAARDVSIRAGATAEIANNALSGAPRRPLAETLVVATTGDIGINAPNSIIVGGSTDAGRNTTIEAFGATGVIRLLQFAGETPLAETADPATLVTMRTRSVFTVASSNLDLNAGGRLVVTDTSDAARFQIDVTGATTNPALGSGRARNVGTADTGTADFTTRPGFAAPATAGWQLSDGEFGTIRATNVEIFADRLLPTNVKSRNVLIGATTIATPVQRFAVRASGDIIVSGAIQMVRGPETAKDVPAGSPLSAELPQATLTLGGRLDLEKSNTDLTRSVQTDVARSVQLVTLTTPISSPNGTPVTEQGSIYAPGTTVRLRGDFVALGLEPVANGQPFLTALLDSTGALVTNEDIRLKYLNNPQSTLYQPLPVYGVTTTGGSPAIVTATTLLLSPTNWALIQNTDRTGQPGGGLNISRLIVTKSAGSPTEGPLVGVFGSIGGRNGVVAPVNVVVGDLNGINPNNVRINGCTALSTASCIVTTLNLSTIGVTDPSRILQVGDAPALDVALPLVTGAGNEALWSDDDEDEDLSLPAAPVKEIKP